MNADYLVTISPWRPHRTAPWSGWIVGIAFGTGGGQSSFLGGSNADQSPAVLHRTRAEAYMAASKYIGETLAVFETPESVLIRFEAIP